jgi:hypothetical protein
MASVLDVMGMENDALLSEVERLVKADRALGATLLVHLGEVDARRKLASEHQAWLHSRPFSAVT